LWPCLTNHDITALKIGTVQGFGCPLGLIVGTHLDETEAFGSAAKLVGDDSGADYGTMLRKVLLEFLFRN
jgi:hypothetical protein